MDNVIKFPSRGAQEWIDLENTIREVMEKDSSSKEMQDEIVDEMRAIFERLSPIEFVFEMPLDISSAQAEKLERSAEDLRTQIKSFTSYTFLEFFILNYKLYQLRHGADA